MKSIRIAAIAALALLSSFVIPAAHADVDIQVRNGDRVIGTINPVNEQEVFRVLVPGGSSLTISAKGKKSGSKKTGRIPAPTVTFRVVDVDDNVIADSSTVGFIAKGKGALLKKFIVPEGDVDEYRIIVTAVGDEGGDYLLKLKWKNKTRHTARANTVNDDPPIITFAADAGSKITAIAIGRGKSIGRLIGIFGIDNDEAFDFEEPNSERVKSHRGKTTLEYTGTFELETDDFTFGDGGPMTVVLIIKPVKSKRKVNIAGKRVGGSPDGNDIVRGQVVGPGGTDSGDLLPFSDLFDENSPLFGTNLEIPEGALNSPTAIFLGSGVDIEPGEGQQGAGPTVSAGPDGTKFNEDVTLTIPYNPNAFNSTQDGLTVLTNDGGDTSEIDVDSIDTDAGTVSVKTDHFSSFRVVGNILPSAPLGDVTGDTIADLLIPAAQGVATVDETVFVFPGGAGFGTLGTAATPADSGFNVFFDGGGGSQFGNSVQTGDVNADGVEDICVADDFSGDVFVFFGGATLTTTGSSAAPVNMNSGIDQMGTDMAVADVDDDNIPDVIAGAPDGSGDDSIGLPGVAYVFGGRVDFGVLPALLEIDDDGVVVIAGENDLDTFGQSVAVGDVNADNKADIVVGATRDSDLRNSPASGTVYVFSGGANLSSVDVNVAAPPVIIRGAHNDDGFGAAAQVADVNGDGVGDLIVGAPKDDGAGEKAGAVYVFFGGTNLRKRTRAADADRKYEGVGADNYFGEYVEAGDVNGDGIDDILIGAPGVSVAGPPAVANAGEAYVIFGATGTDGLPAGGGIAAAAAVTITAEQGGDHLGAFGPSRDYNADGVDDMVLYAPFYATGVNFAQGRAYVFFGSTTFGTLGTAAADTAAVIVTGSDSQQLGDPFRLEILGLGKK